MKIRLFSEVLGMPVMTDYHDRPFGRVRGVIIDPENGKLVAFRLSGQSVVSAYDVVEWGSNIMINDEAHIVPVSEVLRAKKVLEDRRPIFGQKVITEDKQYIGRVYDMGFDPKLFTLRQLFVARGFLVFRWFSTIIPAENIVKVTRLHVIVRSAMEKKKEELPQTTLEPAV